MKILLLTEVFPPRTGGSGRWFWEIYRRLPREQIVIAADNAPDYEQFDRHHNLHLVRMPLGFASWGLASVRSFGQYYRAYRRLVSLIRTEGIDTIHAGKSLPEGLLAWLMRRRLGLPYTCYVHGEELNLAEGSRELRFWTRRVLRGADRVIANSRNTQSLLLKKWQVSPTHVVVLHPGVNAEQFVPALPDPQVRHRLGWGERPVVLTVGRLQKRKGQDMMIRALPTIRRAIPDVLFAIVGKGEEHQILEELVAQLNLERHVKFHGNLDDGELLPCYQQCDLFALPNRDVNGDIEGFGMVLLEAQACGKPVVAGTSGGTAETMRIPETGLVVPCDEPDKLAATVIELLSNKKQLLAMGESARAWALEKFDWSKLSKQAQDVFFPGPTYRHNGAAECPSGNQQLCGVPKIEAGKL
jgi:phosphatidylinositol alpha-1,6-mannosyltransferase